LPGWGILRKEKTMASLHVRRFDTREIVHSVELTSTNDRYVEQVMLGMLRNMNTEEYYVDDSEVYGESDA
jgi:hypothetical protein